MNTKLKERIKLSIAIAVLAVIIIVVLMIVVQYQVEGETNMPFKLSKITVISTAEGEEKTGEEQTNKWDLTVNQNNDIYFFIEQNGENTKEEDLLESVTIENIVVTKQPVKGEVKTYMPNSGEGRTFTYDDQYLVQNSLEYTGSKNNNPKTLEIGSKGGSAIIRFSNTNIGEYISNEDAEIKHDGSLITKTGLTEQDVSFQINFDLILQINKIKYKSNITLDLPCENLTREGTTTKEITDMSNIIFKRVQ